MKRHFGLMVFAMIAVVLAGSSANSQETSWKGKNVLPTKRAKEITFGDKIDGKQLFFEFSGRMPSTVRDELDGWLRIHDGHREAWADKSQFVLVAEAPAYFHRHVQANPKDTFALFMRGEGWLEKGELDNAIKDFDECIRLNPTDEVSFNSRGVAWSNKKEYDKAITDYNEAIRLDPNYALAFSNRGGCWRAKKEYDKAIADYNEAIRFDPKDDWAHYSRAVFQMLTRQAKAVENCQALLGLLGWKGSLVPYAVLLGHFAARQNGDEKAGKRFLIDSAGKLSEDWPYPVIRFLRGEIDESALLKLATDDDKRTEARCYLGLDQALKGQKDQARAHFRWVKEHGTRTYTQYTIAVAELERLERVK